MTGNMTSWPLTKTSSTTVVVTWRHIILRVMTSLSLLLSEMNILCIWQKVKIMNNSRDQTNLQSEKRDFMTKLYFLYAKLNISIMTVVRNDQPPWLSSNRMLTISWLSPGASWLLDLNLGQLFPTRNRPKL